MDIKPIETKYKGYRFRSRLEARWAVFFDEMGIEYQYEPEGFEVDGMRYLPDFYLPDSNKYVEVKGSLEQFKKDYPKMEACFRHNATPISNGLIIVSDIPDSTKEGVPIFPMFSGDDSPNGMQFEGATFILVWVEKENNYEPWVGVDSFDCANLAFRDLYCWCYERGNRDDYYLEGLPKDFSLEPNWALPLRPRFTEGYSRTMAAYEKARSARFEHGEHGEGAEFEKKHGVKLDNMFEGLRKKYLKEEERRS